MQSAKCPQCGFVGWADAEACKKCGAPVQPPPANEPDQSDQNQTLYYPANSVAFAPDPKTGLAVTSLVLGIVNFLFLGITGVTIIAGIVISVVALKRIKRDPLQYGGRSLAVAGLITNIVSVVVLVPFLFILAIAVPNVLAARRAANEGATINTLRKIHAAEITYQSRNRMFGTMSDLEQAKLVESDLATGNRAGYAFKIDTMTMTTVDGLPGFAASAAPSDYPSTGRRSFYIDESGVIRGADNHGLEASKSDPPINLNNDYSPNRSTSRRSSPNSDDE